MRARLEGSRAEWKDRKSKRGTRRRKKDWRDADRKSYREDETVRG